MVDLTKILFKFNIAFMLLSCTLQAQTDNDWEKNLADIQDHQELYRYLIKFPNNVLFLPSIFPFEGKCRISSDFAGRIHPISGQEEFHTGIDFSLKIKSPIIATANGKVYRVGYNNTDGNYVTISHLGGWQSIYCHLSKVMVHINQLVHQNEVIALSGQSGTVTGPHLHYGIKKDGRYYDPLKFCVLKKEIIQR